MGMLYLKKKCHTESYKNVVSKRERERINLNIPYVVSILGATVVGASGSNFVNYVGFLLVCTSSSGFRLVLPAKTP